MTDAITTGELSKAYRLRRGEAHSTLRDLVVRAAGAPLRRLKDPRARKAELVQFWALRDISIAIPQGEVVGFIGRNGAGKTTLLKVLSRITEPTSGWAETRGRVGSLLEVGTGFHPELTGRENVFLNGSILGMSRAEVRERFDEIVDFAGVGQFLDTPVKHYSSGMYVRLAFAVAAHVDPEILIVDEVLSVGDAEFQRKCLAKVREVASEGRTVLFVSHNLAVVQSLCTRAIHLDAGRFVADGPVHGVIDGYLQSLEQLSSENLLERTDRSSRAYEEILLKAVRVSGSGGGSILTGGPATVELELTGLMRNMVVSFVVYDNFGVPVSTFDTRASSVDDVVEADLGARFVCEIPELPLTAGRYRVDVEVHGGAHLQDGIEGAAVFDVVEGVYGGRGIHHTAGFGSTAIAHRWRMPAP